MVTGIIRLEKATPFSIEAFWTIDELDQKLKENDTLQSTSFSFAGQEWRILLSADEMLDGLYIEFILSRITIDSDECNPSVPLVFWNGGVIDKDGASQYSRAGFTRLETTFKEWMTVADWLGPEYTHLCKRKDLFMPEDKLTVVIQLWLDSAAALTTNVQGLTPEESSMECSCTRVDDVVIRVKEQTFHVQSSILEAVSEVLSTEILCSEWDGNNVVMKFPDCDPKAFEFFISFAYSNEFAGLTRDMVEDVYHIADKFDVPKLKEECVRRLSYFLDVSSVCDVLRLADKYRDEVLKERATEFFLKQVREVLRSSKWLELMATQPKLANDLIIRCFEKGN